MALTQTDRTTQTFGPTLVRAAEYMRMSTEHQQYSIANQSAVIEEYANAHAIEIVRTYVDRGKSGLKIQGRDGLRALLRAVQSQSADFSVLLIYDVSRRGRFQDVDESAYHEYLLKKAGIKVIYCAEPFSDSGTATDALLKALKRTMAAEYSRELSVKVSQGQRRIASLGYRVAGTAGFGLRRVAIDPATSRQIPLPKGVRKGIKTDRIVLVPGPEEEVLIVREIFDWFVNQRISEEKIAVRLNDRKIPTTAGGRWRHKAVRDMLRNPKYVGDSVFSRTTSVLGSLARPTPPDSWIYVPNQFEPVVSRDLWNRAQDVFARRAGDLRVDVMLDRLRTLLGKRGKLTADLIDAEPGMQRAQTYRARFGSLIEAYRRIGWASERRFRFLGLAAVRSRWQRQLEECITQELNELGATSSKHEKQPLWNVDGLSIYAVVVAQGKNQRRRDVWEFHGGRTPVSEVLVIARLDKGATRILDYFVFSGGYTTPIRILAENPAAIELHRFPDLSFLEMLYRHIRLEVA
jgi:DNA invertase Pin-like site-specific DNA recombinase